MSFTGSFAIEIDGSPLPDDVVPLLVSAYVDDSQQLPDAFAVRFRDPSRLVLAKTNAAIGSALTIKVKVSGAPAPVVLLTGEVTALEAELDTDGTFTVVRGYDQAHRFLRGRRTASYVQMTASDIVTKVARAAGLRVGEVTPTTTVYPHVTQAGQTDWELLSTLARTSGSELTVRGGKLSFTAPKAASSAPAVGALDLPEPLSLMAGRDLLRVRSVITSAQQVDEVEVRGWDVATKQPLVAVAPARTKGVQLGGADPAKVGAAFGKARYVATDVPYRAQAEVDRAAVSLAEQLAGSFAQLEGVVHGNPQLRAGCAVTLDGVGEPFDGKYTVTSSRHRLDQATGYTTSFAVTGRQDRTLLGLTGAGSRPAAGTGVVVAQVSDVSDPQHAGRVRLTFPWLSADYVSDWARTLQPGAGKARGSQVLPEVGDEVLVAFEQGDLGRPTVLGGLYNGQDTPATGQGDLVDPGTGAVNRRSQVSRLGHRIDLLDADRASGVRVATAEDKLVVTLDQTKTEITVHSDGKVTVTGSKGITLEAAQGPVEIKGTSISLKGSQGVAVDGGSGQVEVKTTGALAIKGGMKASLTGDAEVELASTGTCTIRGATVGIN